MRFSRFFDSYCWLRDRSPVERLGPSSRYVIVSDLLLGDGGKDDSFVRGRGLAEAVLRSAYLAQGHTLVLAGDTEDLRRFWYKDIMKAWRDLNGLFSEFAVHGSLRKLLGERDLGLMRKPGFSVPLLHGLRLQSKGVELFVLHGHQASRYFAGLDYGDFLLRQMEKPFPVKDAKDLDDPGRLLRVELRLERASRRLGIATLFGHTGRALFESRSDYDYLRTSVEELLHRGAEEGKDGTKGDGLLDSLLGLYRKEIARLENSGEVPGPTLQETCGGTLFPCLFNPGPALAGKGFNVLEIEGGMIRAVRWLKSDRVKRSLQSRALRVEKLQVPGLARCVLREAELDAVAEGIRLAGAAYKEHSGQPA